jgi:N-sulfoglucosamine sulfohydrolase
MSTRQPNILLITCHDLGRHLGCYGVSTVRTPNLDRLAAEGIRFERAFCTAPQCSPSRASLFTGRYPHANGVMGLTHGQFAWDLHPDERHIAQVLNDAGYMTAIAGLHHEARSVERCGFQEIVPQGHGAELSVQALAKIAEYTAGDRPFYLQLGYHEPHRAPSVGEDADLTMGFLSDYIAPDDSLGVTVPPWLRDEPPAREELAELQGAIHYLDAAVGTLLEGVRALGIEENTLVIFTTDHGVALPRAKCSLYDPGVEVALLMRLPARGWTGGRVLRPLVSNIDLFPMLLELAGVQGVDAVQGLSLTPLLDGAIDTHRDTIFAEMTYHDYYHPQRAIRTETHKLIVNFTNAPSFMDPSQSWLRRTRPVVPAQPASSYTPAIELYDLTRDPLEWTNLEEQPDNAAIRDDLLARLGDWMRDTHDPLLDGAVTSPRHRLAVDALQRLSQGGLHHRSDGS